VERRRRVRATRPTLYTSMVKKERSHRTRTTHLWRRRTPPPLPSLARSCRRHSSSRPAVLPCIRCHIKEGATTFSELALLPLLPLPRLYRERAIPSNFFGVLICPMREPQRCLLLLTLFLLLDDEAVTFAGVETGQNQRVAGGGHANSEAAIASVGSVAAIHVLVFAAQDWSVKKIQTFGSTMVTERIIPWMATLAPIS